MPDDSGSSAINKQSIGQSRAKNVQQEGVHPVINEAEQQVAGKVRDLMAMGSTGGQVIWLASVLWEF